MIRKIFEKTSEKNRAALVAFVSCGDPNLNFTEKLVERICSSGADIVELGVPFSDPMADGPAVQGANLRAIKSETSIDGILSMVGNLRAKGICTPFVIHSYYNPVFKRGVEKTMRDCAKLGVNACAILDIPLEESCEVLVHTKKFDLNFIAFASSTTSLERLAEISKASSGFLYYIITDNFEHNAAKLSESLVCRLKDVKKTSSLPVLAGLDASNIALTHDIAQHADAVLIGESLVDLVHKTCENESEERALEEAEKLISSIAAQMNRKAAD